MIEVTAEGRVLRVALNRPEQRNALNIATCRELLEIFERAEADPGVGAVVLCGHGTSFCSGMDLAEVLAADQSELAGLHERLFTTIQRARTPMVAAVHGGVMAAGVGLVANSHLVVSAPEAKFGLTEIRIGLWPMMVYRAVARAIGERRATELSLTGRVFSAEEALGFGLVTEVSVEPLVRGMALAQGIAMFSPKAIASGLECAHLTRDLSWEEAAPVAREMRAELMASADFTEGVRAFLEKRAAVWPSLAGND